MRFNDSLALIVLITSLTINVWADVINDPKTGNQIRASCETYDISITPYSRFRNNVTLSNTKGEPTAFEAIKPFKSPYGDSYLKILNADSTVPPKEGTGWTSYVYVKHINGSELEITIKDHNNYGILAYWRDNNTIVIETWWGRIMQSIFRLNLSSELFMTSEDRGYFEETLPCNKRES